MKPYLLIRTSKHGNTVRIGGDPPRFLQLPDYRGEFAADEYALPYEDVPTFKTLKFRIVEIWRREEGCRQQLVGHFYADVNMTNEEAGAKRAEWLEGENERIKDRWHRFYQKLLMDTKSQMEAKIINQLTQP